jgi:hypothetical protein
MQTNVADSWQRWLFLNTAITDFILKNWGTICHPVGTAKMGADSDKERFYNKRGTAEQRIKEGKQAVAMDTAFLPPLPGQRGAAVAQPARLQPRQPVAAAGAAGTGRQLVAEQPVSSGLWKPAGGW